MDMIQLFNVVEVVLARLKCVLRGQHVFCCGCIYVLEGLQWIIYWHLVDLVDIRAVDKLTIKISNPDATENSTLRLLSVMCEKHWFSFNICHKMPKIIYMLPYACIFHISL